jgi:hypothetical protein
MWCMLLMNEVGALESCCIIKCLANGLVQFFDNSDKPRWNRRNREKHAFRLT